MKGNFENPELNVQARNPGEQEDVFFEANKKKDRH